MRLTKPRLTKVTLVCLRSVRSYLMGLDILPDTSKVFLEPKTVSSSFFGIFSQVEWQPLYIYTYNSLRVFRAASPKNSQVCGIANISTQLKTPPNTSDRYGRHPLWVGLHFGQKRTSEISIIYFSWIYREIHSCLKLKWSPNCKQPTWLDVRRWKCKVSSLVPQQHPFLSSY